MESYGAYKQFDSRSATDARAMKTLKKTTFNDSRRYRNGMLWEDEESTLLPNNNLAPVQHKSLENKMKKNHQLKENFSKIFKKDFGKKFRSSRYARLFPKH